MPVAHLFRALEVRRESAVEILENTILVLETSVRSLGGSILHCGEAPHGVPRETHGLAWCRSRGQHYVVVRLGGGLGVVMRSWMCREDAVRYLAARFVQCQRQNCGQSGWPMLGVGYTTRIVSRYILSFLDEFGHKVLSITASGHRSPHSVPVSPSQPMRANIEWQRSWSKIVELYATLSRNAIVPDSLRASQGRELGPSLKNMSLAATIAKGMGP